MLETKAKEQHTGTLKITLGNQKIAINLKENHEMTEREVYHLMPDIIAERLQAKVYTALSSLSLR